MKKYLQSLSTGAILPFNERLLNAGGVKVVTEAEAFPQKFAPVPLKGRKAKVDVTVPVELVEAPPEMSPELQADASRRFGPRNTFKSKLVAGLPGE